MKSASFMGSNQRVTAPAKSIQRPNNSVRTKRKQKFFLPENAPTAEEINVLKKEKQNLIQEKSLLKAKITRLIDITKHPEKYTNKITTDPNSLEKEYKQIEQMSASRRAEIAQLISSDLAATVNELQEECLMLHMELIRVKGEKNKAEQDLRSIAKQLQDAKYNFSPELEKKQRKIISDLERQIAEQKIRNCKIQAKLDTQDFYDYRESQRVEINPIVAQTLMQLDAKLKSEQADVLEIEEETRKIEEEKLREIEELQKKLSEN